MAITRTQTLNDKIVSTIDTYIRKTPADVIFEQNLLFGALWQADRMPGAAGEKPKLKVPSGRVKRQSGRSLVIPIATKRATTVVPFTNNDILPVNLDPVMTMQEFHYAYYTAFAGINWQEAKENMGPEKMIDIMQSRVDMTLRTTSEELEGDLWSSNDGSTVDSNDQNKRVLGLQFLVPQDPTTGTVWGINRATETYQRSQTSGDVNDTFANSGMTEMRDMWMDVTGTAGTDRPTVILTTPVLFNAYTKEAEDIHQITKAGLADLGFESAVFRGDPLTYSAQAPDEHMWFLNLSYWDLFMPPGAAFDSRFYNSPPNQLMEALWRIVVGIQWGCERFDRQGLIYGFTDA